MKKFLMVILLVLVTNTIEAATYNYYYTDPNAQGQFGVQNQSVPMQYVYPQRGYGYGSYPGYFNYNPFPDEARQNQIYQENLRK